MRTLLTGATGYIGLHIVRELLEDGQDVTVVVRSPEKLGPFARHDRLRVVEADLVEDEAQVLQALPGHDTCIHAALIWGEPGSELDVRDTAVAARLFDAAGRAGVKRSLYLSSVAVHRPFTSTMSEEDPLQPTDLYGATKAAGELFLRAACAAHAMTGVVLRPGPVVGPPAFPGGSFRSAHRITEMVTAAVEGRAIEVVQNEGRQFVDVRTVAKAIRLLTRVENPHPTTICVDRDPILWERVAQTVVDCLGSRSEVQCVPRKSAAPVPRFRTERVEELLGGPLDAHEALQKHIRHLANGD